MAVQAGWLGRPERQVLLKHFVGLSQHRQNGWQKWVRMLPKESTISVMNHVFWNNRWIFVNKRYGEGQGLCLKFRRNCLCWENRLRINRLVSKI